MCVWYDLNKNVIGPKMLNFYRLCVKEVNFDLNMEKLKLLIILMRKNMETEIFFWILAKRQAQNFVQKYVIFFRKCAKFKPFKFLILRKI